MVVLLYCYLVLFPFGQLTRLPLGIAEINLYLTDILILGFVVTWLGRKLIKREKFIPPPLTKPILLFTFCCFLSLMINTPLLSGREVMVAGLYVVRWILYAGLYFVVFDLIHKSRTKIPNLKSQIPNLLIGAGLVSAIFGLLQYLFLPDTRFLEKYGWDPHLYRVIGTFLDPGFLGLILVFTLILLTLKLWPARKLSWRGIAWVVVYLALALTYSRASYMAYLVGMGTIAWFKKSPKFFLTLFFLGMVTIFLLPRPGGEGVKLERESTIQFRLINYGQSLAIVRDNPLFGVGFNAYRYAQGRHGFLTGEELKSSHAGAGGDSSLLFVLATTGIIGLAFYLWLWGKALWLGKTNILALATLFSALVHSFFINSLFYPWIMAWLWLVLGVVRGNKKQSVLF
jgi:O-antigen ligase